jgi:hypothetical protein
MCGILAENAANYNHLNIWHSLAQAEPCHHSSKQDIDNLSTCVIGINKCITSADQGVLYRRTGVISICNLPRSVPDCQCIAAGENTCKIEDWSYAIRIAMYKLQYGSPLVAPIVRPDRSPCLMPAFRGTSRLESNLSIVDSCMPYAVTVLLNSDQGEYIL